MGFFPSWRLSVAEKQCRRIFDSVKGMAWRCWRFSKIFTVSESQFGHLGVIGQVKVSANVTNFDHTSVRIKQAAVVSDMVGVDVEVIPKEGNTCWTLGVSNSAIADDDTYSSFLDVV